MQFGVHCIECLIKRQASLMYKQDGPEELKEQYMKEIMDIMIHAPKDVAAPYLIAQFNKVYARLFHVKDIYARIKRESNDLVLARAPGIQSIIDRAEDPFLCALQFARVGNYIDFGAMHDDVTTEKLDELLAGAPEDQVDPVEYQNFRRDLEGADKLLYITDNAGEVVLDKLFVQQLQKSYPKLEITVAVRGAPVLNDALREDMAYIGMDKLCRIIDNGTPISGTQMNVVGEEMRRELETSPVILSKGQGNFETLWGCGLNVYYAFLCKCQWFTELFRVPQFTSMFVNENRVIPGE